jgi:hypothetical protein
VAGQAVKDRLHAIAQRRAILSSEIQQQRAKLRGSLGVVSQELAFAGLGLIVGRVLISRPWLRAVALGGLAVWAAKKRSAA